MASDLGYLPICRQRKKSFTYFRRRQQTKITGPDGAERSFVYDALNQMIEQITPLGDTERMTYDAFGRNTGIERTDGGLFQIAAAETQGLVDPASGQGSAANPAPLVRPEAIAARITDALGNVTTLETNGFGASNRTTDALGRVTDIFRDANNNPTRVVRPNGRIDDFVYDARGNLLSATQIIEMSKTSTSKRVYSSDMQATGSTSTATTKATPISRFLPAAM